MTTDYKQLCAELLRGLDENRHPEIRYPGHLRFIMAAARAALAEPEPEESPQPVPVLPEGAPIIEPPDHTLLAPIAQPVPVSERMPEEPLAWWFTPESDEEYGWWVLEPNGMEREPQPTHWLPAHTLPLPTTSRSI